MTTFAAQKGQLNSARRVRLACSRRDRGQCPVSYHHSSILRNGGAIIVLTLPFYFFLSVVRRYPPTSPNCNGRNKPTMFACWLLVGQCLLVYLFDRDNDRGCVGGGHGFHDTDKYFLP